MTDKRFCNRCSGEIGFVSDKQAHASFGVGKDGDTSKSFGYKDSKGNEITLLNSRVHLCLDCYVKLVKFMESADTSEETKE